MGEAIISRTLENEILVVQETGTSTTDVMSQKAVTDELNNKVDKVEGKGLSTNDFTTEDKEKLDNAVPNTRTVNAKPLTSDIVLTADNIGALPDTTVIPTKTSELQNDSGFLTQFIETDPTVPAWAKSPNKPVYTASEINAVPTTRTVNSKQLTSDVVLTPEDIGALPTSFSNHTHSADNITSGVLPVSRGGTGSNTPEYARSNLDVYSKAEVDFKLSASNLGNILYPVGSIYLSVNSTNPQYLFGGTWEQIKDRFLLGAGDSYYAGLTGGEAMHTLTQNEMPQHSHRVNKSPTEQRWSVEDGYWANFRCGTSNTIGGDIYTQSSGGGQAHNNMPPYVAVYMWKRIA